MTEIWKDAVGYEGVYQVSSRGRVKRVAGGPGAQAGRILKPRPNTVTGYLDVSLYRDGRRTHELVHRLVLKAHVGPAPEGCEGNHRNGDKTDNRVENLEWVTPSENTRHAFRELGHEGVKGETVSLAKNTREDVLEIRELYATGRYTQRELGEMFGVSDVCISLIVRRKTWKHVP